MRAEVRSAAPVRAMPAGWNRDEGACARPGAVMEQRVHPLRPGLRGNGTGEDVKTLIDVTGTTIDRPLHDPREGAFGKRCMPPRRTMPDAPGRDGRR